MEMENPYNIQIISYPMGKDYAFLITGGEAHIGAVATSFWSNKELKIDVIELPHHKEGELAKECAHLAAQELECTVSVSIGIHVDHATKEQIQSIVDFVREAMKEKILSLKRS